MNNVVLDALRIRAAFAEGRHEGIYFSEQHYEKVGLPSTPKSSDSLNADLASIEEALSNQEIALDKVRLQGRKAGLSFVIRLLNSVNPENEIIPLFEGMYSHYRTPNLILFYHRFASAGHAGGLLCAIEECHGKRDCIVQEIQEIEKQIAKIRARWLKAQVRAFTKRDTWWDCMKHSMLLTV